MSLNREDIVEVTKKDFLESVKNIFGENLLSVMLYGSVLSDSFVPGISDVNVLIILKNVKLQELYQFSKNSYKLIKKYHITPLILSRMEFINSADVFPVEYYDIKENNSVIYGEDETKNLEITNKNLRHQIESGLRGNLNRLRQVVIASKEKDQILVGFFKNWMGSILSMFRGLIRLKYESNKNQSNEINTDKINHDKVIEKVAELYGINSEVFQNLLHLRRKKKDLNIKELASYAHEELKKLIEIVDKLDFKD